MFSYKIILFIPFGNIFRHGSTEAQKNPISIHCFCDSVAMLVLPEAKPLCLRTRQDESFGQVFMANNSYVNCSMTPERFERLTSVLNKRQTDLTVLLENVFDPHNISAVMRTCDAVGIQDIYILNTKIPPHKKWGAKSSSSAAKWLSVHQFTDAVACFAELRKHYKKIYTTHLSTDAVGLYELNLTEPVALVFGNEHSGVSEEIIAMADGNFIIPQAGIIKSLNISVACAVCLYEAYRQKANAGHYELVKLGGEKLIKLRDEWGFIEE